MRLQHLDEKDKQIISVLVKNPDASQSNIAKQVNLSQPAVGARLQRLKESGHIALFVGMDVKKVGFHLAKVEIAAKNVENVLSRLENCPFFFNGLMVSGKHNLCILLVGEDISTLEALAENHVRNDPDVSDTIFNVVTNTSSNFIIPIILSFEKSNTPPCGRECKCVHCSSYEMGRCTGCPATEFYRGTFWS